MTAIQTPHLRPERWNLDHREPLLRFALQRISDYGSAEDLVQDTFLSAWKGRHRFRGDCTERSWLTGILRNKIIDHYRRRSRRPSVLASDLEPEGLADEGSWIERQPDPAAAADPLAALSRREFLDELERAVSELPEKMREAFRLREFEGLDTEEIVARLGISKSNLWVLIHRAKQALAGSLEAHRSQPAASSERLAA